MAIGEFTLVESENALEKLREMFNAIPQEQRKDYIHPFSIVGTYIQATQRHLKPLCGDTPNGNG